MTVRTTTPFKNSYLYDTYHDRRIDVDIVENKYGNPTICQIAIETDDDCISIGLTPSRVAELRKILQRVERRFR